MPHQKGYDSIRKHLAVLNTADENEIPSSNTGCVHRYKKEQRGQYWLENIMKDKFAVSMFGAAVIISTKK